MEAAVHGVLAVFPVLMMHLTFFDKERHSLLV